MRPANLLWARIMDRISCAWIWPNRLLDFDVPMSNMRSACWICGPHIHICDRILPFSCPFAAFWFHFHVLGSLSLIHFVLNFSFWSKQDIDRTSMNADLSGRDTNLDGLVGLSQLKKASAVSEDGSCCILGGEMEMYSWLKLFGSRLKKEVDVSFPDLLRSLPCSPLYIFKYIRPLSLISL